MGGGRVSALTLCFVCGRGSPAACAVQPSASRCRIGDRLPVLSYLGGKFEFCRYPSYQDLHELPLPDMEERADAGAGAGELSYR